MHGWLSLGLLCVGLFRDGFGCEIAMGVYRFDNRIDGRNGGEPKSLLLQLQFGPQIVAYTVINHWAQADIGVMTPFF